MNEFAEKNVRTSSQNTLTLLWIFVLVSMFAAWLAGNYGLYEAGDSTGYNLGLVGGIMMLILLSYPAAKRIRLLQRLISLRHWFRLHMMMGIIGPVLIIFHSRLEVGSTNGAVAYYSMLAVFFSGLVGRYIYTRIHHGLYGRRATLAEIRQNTGLEACELKTRMGLSQRLVDTLQSYEKQHVTQSDIWFIALLRLFFHPLRFTWYSLRIRRYLQDDMRKIASEKNFDRVTTNRQISNIKGKIHLYMKHVDEVGQFHVYERLFSLWHYLHIPLLFLLIVSAAIHVFAVHMY